DGGRTISKYRKDEIVFAQGDPANAVFYIRKGECKVTVVSQQGKEAVVAIHSKGDFFGEGCLNGHTRRLATVPAVTACETCGWRKPHGAGAPRSANIFRAIHLTSGDSKCA